MRIKIIKLKENIWIGLLAEQNKKNFLENECLDKLNNLGNKEKNKFKLF
ncbi:MAG: hypothetical protein N3B16_02870 [Candidatus Aminicenantes bacterium]|nr:hypothetical protein [Candidatus Aminicenantes bacterium]